MLTYFIPYSFRKSKRNSGQALIWILILVGVSTLAISAICKIALWKLDSTIAIMSQRNLIEGWEAERVSLIKNAFPTSSFKRINIQNNQLAIPILSKKELKIDSLRIPLFNLGDKSSPRFNWSLFLKESHGSCLTFDGYICRELWLEGGKSRIIGDLLIDELKLPTGLSVIVATRDVTIKSLKLEPGAAVEILAGFNLTLNQITQSSDSTLFLTSINGQINLVNTTSIDCPSSLQIKINSTQPIQLKNRVVSSSGCKAVKLSQFWQDLRYVGDLSQKSLN